MASLSLLNPNANLGNVFANPLASNINNGGVNNTIDKSLNTSSSGSAKGADSDTSYNPSVAPSWITNGTGGIDTDHLSGTEDFLDHIQAIADSNSAKSQSWAEKEMAFNAEEAQKNRDWQKMMSDTAHQREVADLIAAGLNPVLAAGGTGAAVTSGATASGSHGQTDNSMATVLGSYLNALINSATQINTAQTYANATMSSAAMNAQASMYSANTSAQASMRNADVSAAASRYGTETGADIAKKQNIIGILGTISGLLFKAWQTSKFINLGEKKLIPQPSTPKPMNFTSGKW